MFDAPVFSTPPFSVAPPKLAIHRLTVFSVTLCVAVVLWWYHPKYRNPTISPFDCHNTSKLTSYILTVQFVEVCVLARCYGTLIIVP